MARTKYERKLQIKRAREGEKTTTVEVAATEKKALQREDGGKAAVVVVAAVVAQEERGDGRAKGNPVGSIGVGINTELEEGEVPNETQADMAMDVATPVAPVLPSGATGGVSSSCVSSPRSSSSSAQVPTTTSDGDAATQANQVMPETHSDTAEASAAPTNRKSDQEQHHETSKETSLSTSSATNNSETSTTLPQDEMHEMLQRLEAEIAARITKRQSVSQTKVRHQAHGDPSQATTVTPTESLCSHHDQQIRQLECDLELALRRADTLAAQNAEWKRASHKQLDYQSALRELHIVQRTQAEQLRRVAMSLKTNDATTTTTVSGWGSDAITALNEIAQAMHPLLDPDTKALYPNTPNAIVFRPQCTRICKKSGGSRDWHSVKKEGEEEGDISDEYAIRVFQLTDEPLKKRPHFVTPAESSCVDTAPLPPTKIVEDHSQSHAYIELLKQSKRLMTEPYLYAPRRSKRQRTLPGDSSSDDDDDEDDDVEDTPSAQVVFESCSSSAVHRGSDDAFLLISL